METLVEPFERPSRSGRDFWMIATQDDPAEFLNLELSDGREAMPVFSFEEEAWMFLKLNTYWQTHPSRTKHLRVRRTSRENLASLLLGDYRSVSLVMLDPIPGGIEEELLSKQASIHRESFLRFFVAPDTLAGVRSTTPQETPQTRGTRKLGVDHD